MRKRHGFTIIELLVAMALIVTIMAILSEAFRVGQESFGRLKALGDMSDRLRAAANMIRNDLAADHFNGSIRLSDANFGRGSDPFSGQSSNANFRPSEGYFLVKTFGPIANEGVDVGGLPSIRVPLKPGASQILCMTVRTKGTARDDGYSASLPDGSPLIAFPDPTTVPSQPADARKQDNRPGAAAIYRSPWAEVGYFLQPLPENTITGPLDQGGQRLYSLHRVQQILVPDSRELNSGRLPRVASANYQYVQFSGDRRGPNLAFNSPRDVTVDPNRRAFNNLVHHTGARKSIFTTDPTSQDPLKMNDYVTGVETMLCSDVVSFSVELLTGYNIGGPYTAGGMPPFGFPAYDTRPGKRPDFAAPAGPLSIGGIGYDSSFNATPVLAVRVTLRIWDIRTQQTRQISIIQDM